jgi:hypothetical protein
MKTLSAFRQAVCPKRENIIALFRNEEGFYFYLLKKRNVQYLSFQKGMKFFQKSSFLILLLCTNLIPEISGR